MRDVYSQQSRNTLLAFKLHDNRSSTASLEKLINVRLPEKLQNIHQINKRAKYQVGNTASQVSSPTHIINTSLNSIGRCYWIILKISSPTTLAHKSLMSHCVYFFNLTHYLTGRYKVWLVLQSLSPVWVPFQYALCSFFWQDDTFLRKQGIFESFKSMVYTNNQGNHN